MPCTCQPLIIFETTALVAPPTSAASERQFVQPRHGGAMGAILAGDHFFQSRIGAVEVAQSASIVFDQV